MKRTGQEFDNDNEELFYRKNEFYEILASSYDNIICIKTDGLNELNVFKMIQQEELWTN